MTSVFLLIRDAVMASQRLESEFQCLVKALPSPSGKTASFSLVTCNISSGKVLRQQHFTFLVISASEFYLCLTPNKALSLCFKAALPFSCRSE